MNRRSFIKSGAFVTTSVLSPSIPMFGKHKEVIRLAFIGVGLRGRNHVDLALRRDDIHIAAICDIQEESLASCKKQFEKANKKLPKIYTGSLDAYKDMLEKEQLDAVIIATPWQFHKNQAIDAMKVGLYVGCEVIAGLTVEDHWEIVKTSEQTGKPYMTLENVCYRRDVMAVLNMVRQNLFGELIHLEGGYQHNLREVLFNDGVHPYGGGVEYGPKGFSEAKWRTQFNIDQDGDLYPTHGLGPLMHYTKINHGNRMTNLVSFSSKARGLSDYVQKQSPGHPNAKIAYKNGDVTTTMINCANGETLLLSHDVHLPRPYSLGFRVQGTDGLWMDVNNGIYIEGKSAKHDIWDKADEWLAKYDHPLWKKYANDASGAGHGGMDWFVFNAFIESVKQNRQTPIDVYDSVSMSVITPLSTKSLAEGNKSMDIPDFTNGKWKERKDIFALDDSGF